MKRFSSSQRRLPGWRRRKRKVFKSLSAEGVAAPQQSEAWGPPHTFSPPPTSDAPNTLDDVLEELARMVEEDEPQFEETARRGAAFASSDPQGDILSELAERIPTEALPLGSGELLSLEPDMDDEEYEAPPPPIWRVHSRRLQRRDSVRRNSRRRSG